MPTAQLKSFAKQAGISTDKVEKLWDKAKVIATEELGKKEKDFTEEDWSYVSGIVKNMMGIKEKKEMKKVEEANTRSGKIEVSLEFSGPYGDRETEEFKTFSDFNSALEYAIRLYNKYKPFSDRMTNYKADLTINDPSVPYYYYWLVKEGKTIESGLSSKDVNGFIINPKTKQVLDYTKENKEMRKVERKMKEYMDFSVGDRVVTSRGAGEVIDIEGTSPPMVKVLMDDGKTLFFRVREVQKESVEKNINKDIFFESDLSAKEFIEAKCKKDEEEEEDESEEEDEEEMEEGSKDTAKCPTCGNKYLKATGYCVTCKKKVKESDEPLDEVMTSTAVVGTATPPTHATIKKDMHSKIKRIGFYASEKEDEDEDEDEDEEEMDETMTSGAFTGKTPEKPAKVKKKKESSLPSRMVKDYEMRAEAERKGGGSVEINRNADYVAVTMSDGAEYFFQDWEASELLDDVPDNINAEDYILAVAQGW